MVGLLGQGFEDPKSAAIMALSGGLLRGDFGGGLLGANQAFTQAQQAKQQQGLLGMQMEEGQLKLRQLRQQMADDERARGILQQVYGSQGMPGSMPKAGGPTDAVNSALPPEFQIGALPPTPGYQSAVTAKADVWKRYQDIGNQFAAAGLPKQAEQYYGMAEKMRPKFSTTPQVVRDPATGKLVNVLIGEDGSTQTISYGVKPDIRLQDLGGSVMAIDTNAAQGGQSYQKTGNPYSDLILGDGKGGFVPNSPLVNVKRQIASDGSTKVAVNTNDPTALAKAGLDLQDRVRTAFKDDNVIANQYRAMLNAVNNPSAQGDTALLYSFFKVLDPQSTVREGEIDMVKSSRSIPDRFKGYAQKLANGQTLMPNERQDILSQAARQVQARMPRALQEVKAYKENASRLALDPNLYVPNPYDGINFASGGGGGGQSMDWAAAARAELERRSAGGR